jgi:hypothetical protein
LVDIIETMNPEEIFVSSIIDIIGYWARLPVSWRKRAAIVLYEYPI